MLLGSRSALSLSDRPDLSVRRFVRRRPRSLRRRRAAWLARVLLICTFVLLGLCFSLLSACFFVDELGVGVGFLLRVRRTAWHELASVGVLSCNSRRTYLYGLYTHSTGFSGTAAPRARLRKLGVRRADQQKAGQRGARSLPGGNRLHARAAQTPRQSPSPALASGGRCICCCSFPEAHWRFSPAP